MKTQVTIHSLIFAILLIGSYFQTQATHFMGVSMSYECLGGCIYRIYHDGYYDCGGGVTTPLPGPPVNPTISFTPSSCTQPLPISAWIPVHYIEITPICPGFQTQCTNPGAPINGVLEGRFYRDFNFCGVNCSTYAAIWTSCCRNGTITSGAANNGIAISLSLNLGLSPCNNSPKFTSTPSPYICAGTAASISQGAYDPDGDSLVYSLGPCYSSNTGTQVTYNTGFSPTSPLGPSWSISMNPLTGQIDILPSPGNIATGVICVYVDEWRNGAFIGQISRDIQITVISCGNNANSPVLDSVHSVVNAIQTGPTSFQTCAGSQVSISFDVSDADTADNIIVTSNILNAFPSGIITTSGTNPVQATLTFSPSANGIYGFSIDVKDNHCPVPGYTSRNFTVRVGGACVTGVVTNTPCMSSIGAVDITVSGGQAPYTYLWSNGATTEDISGLAPGQYTVTVTDANGFVFSNSFWVNASNLNVATTLTHPDCNGVPGGIQTSTSGGTAPYTYLWNTGATTSNLTGLQPGGYSLTVTDVNGCTRHLATLLDQPDSCFNFIEGYIYDDINQNCIQDPGEPPLPNVYVDITPGWATTTDLNGFYRFVVDTGNYVVEITPTAYSSPLCPATNVDSVYFVGLKQTHSMDFAMDVVHVQDLRLSMYPGRARVGRTKYSYLTVRNEGSTTMSGSLTFTHDPSFEYVSSTPAANVYDSLTSTALWTFSNLYPGQRLRMYVRTKVDTSAIIGSPWSESAMVTPIVGDTTPGNNVLVYNDTIRGSFDPNDKQVFPQGIRVPGYILPTDDLMQYTVRFQNTGNDTAFYVVIRDTLDSDVEVSSFVPESESHSYSLVVEDDSVLVFTFANILLPDSGTNLLGSNGHVSFTLRHNGTLSPGTVIENSAAIYFDFNAPVITNTVTNTIYTQPVVGLGNDTTICEGQFLEGNIIAAGMPPYDFSWSTGDMDPGNFAGVSQTAVTASGPYAVTVTDAFGFTTTDMVDVTADPLPDAAFSLSQNNLTVTLNNSSNANATWAWDFGDGNATSGSPAASHTYASNGVYTVTLITTNNCGTDTATQVIDFTTDLDQDEFVQSIITQPNPFSSSTLVSFANHQRLSYSIYLYDLQGRQVREYQTKGEQVEIRRGDLSRGIYLLEVRGEAVYYGRLVVE